MIDLINKAKQFKHTSLEYLESEDISNAEIIIDNNEALIIYTISNGRVKIDWATDSPQILIDTLKGLTELVFYNHDAKKIYVEFIPEDYVVEMESHGFKIISEWLDFWNYELETCYFNEPKDLLIRNIEGFEYQIASEITKSCKGLSRGYNGESADWLREWNENENSCLFVAEVNNNIVGICCVSLYGFESSKGTVLWIREIAVNPKYHQRKIGLNLMLYAIDWGKKHDAMRSFLACDIDNRNAIRLYEGIGYQRRAKRGQINMEKKVKE